MRVKVPVCSLFSKCQAFGLSLTLHRFYSAWTICESTPLSTEGTENDKQSPVTGPFRDYRMELGIQSDDVRFRVKFDYSVLASDVSSGLTSSLPPPLHLKTMTVCREAASVWPRSSTLSESLFRAASGAPGGLYDPPPINEQYLAQYCTVDMEGGATALFPVVIDQANVDDDGDLDNDKISWTTSLDWTAGPMRFQVDRKSYSGINLRGLRTLELSEVQGADADQYRPRDGGQNMRQ